MKTQQLEQWIAQYNDHFARQNLNCAEAVLTIMGNYYGVQSPLIPRIATGFGGGIAGTQGFCGALSGGMMVIGLRLGREIGGDKAPANEMGKRFIDWASGVHGSTNCRQISGADLSNPQEREAFRAPGGAHKVICEPLVGEVCRWLARNLPETEA